MYYQCFEGKWSSPTGSELLVELMDLHTYASSVQTVSYVMCVV